MKFELEPLKLSNLTNLQVVDMVARLLSQVVTVPTERGADVTANQRYIDGLISRHGVFRQAILPTQASAFTRQISAADDECELALSVFRQAVHLGFSSDVAAEAEAARCLLLVLAKYNGLEDADYGTQTSGIDKLLSDLADGATAPHVGTLALGRYVYRLTKANDAFKVLVDSRTMDASAKEVFDNKALRYDLLGHYREYALFVQAMANANDGGYYARLLAVINSTRKHYADLLARRAPDAPAPDAPAAN